MRFLKSLICNCLYINNFYKNKELPINYYGIKKIKKIYHENNVYFDIYNDDVNILNNEFMNLNYKKFNSLTAEHIFPQSYTKEYKYAKYDMHNIFLTKSLLNSNRSNYKYSDEKEENLEDLYLLDYDYFLQYNRLYNYKNNKKKIFVPYKNSRGIIARSIAYMDITYNKINITNVIELDTLIKWNNDYPPTLFEKKQNNIIKKYQGNNNIFIKNNKLINYYYKKII